MFNISQSFFILQAKKFLRCDWLGPDVVPDKFEILAFPLRYIPCSVNKALHGVCVVFGINTSL